MKKVDTKNQHRRSFIAPVSVINDLDFIFVLFVSARETNNGKSL